MRKLSYIATFFAVAATLLMNVLSARRPDWLVTKTAVFHSKVTVRYGLSQRCESQVVDVPGGGIAYTEFACRPFPTRAADNCEHENRRFCAAWSTAGYVAELAIGFGAVALVAIVFGVSTHSRRRRVWKAVAGLVAFHALFQIIAFSIVTHLYSYSVYPSFDRARPATAYVLNAVSWVLALSVIIGVVTTGLSANAGHRWAAGNRGYQPIQG